MVSVKGRTAETLRWSRAFRIGLRRRGVSLSKVLRLMNFVRSDDKGFPYEGCRLLPQMTLLAPRPVYFNERGGRLRSRQLDDSNSTICKAFKAAPFRS